jgi:hypothetical protein
MGNKSKLTGNSAAEKIDDFLKYDVSAEKIRKYSDEDLAYIQSDHEPNTPIWNYCNIEWQRRLLNRQSRVAVYCAIVGVVATLAGVALGWFLKP